MAAEEAPPERPQVTQRQVEVVVRSSCYEIDITSKLVNDLERHLLQHPELAEKPILARFEEKPHTLNFVGPNGEHIATVTGVTRMQLRAVLDGNPAVLTDLTLIGAQCGEEDIELPKKPEVAPLSETMMNDTSGTRVIPLPKAKPPEQKPKNAGEAAREQVRRYERPRAGEKPIEKPVSWEQENSLRVLLEDQRDKELRVSSEMKMEKKPLGKLGKLWKRVSRSQEPPKPRKQIEWGTYLIKCLEKLEAEHGVMDDKSRPSKVITLVGLQHAQIQRLVTIFLMDLSADPANRKSRFISNRVTREHVQLAQQFIEEKLGTVIAEAEGMAIGAYSLDMGRVLRGLKSTTACVREASINRLALVAPQELRACQGKKQFDEDRAKQLCDAIETAKGLEEFSRLNDKDRAAFDRQEHDVQRTISRRTGMQADNWYATVSNPKVEARRAKLGKKSSG